MLKNLKIFDVWFFSLFEWILAPYWSDWFLSKIVIRHCDGVLYSASLNWKILILPKFLAIKTLWRKNLIKLCFIAMWYGQMDCSRSSEPLFGSRIGTLFLLFTSICPPRKILMLWSLKISPCILKCSGTFKLSEIFEFSLLPDSWFADFLWFSSTIKDGYHSTVEPYFLNKLT